MVGEQVAFCAQFHLANLEVCAVVLWTGHLADTWKADWAMGFGFEKEPASFSG